MREGKVTRLRAVARRRGLPAALLDEAAFYSDSINDLPLLRAVGQPVAVDPDDAAAGAGACGWLAVLRLAR